MRRFALILIIICTNLGAFAQGRILWANDSLHLFNLASTLPADSAVAGPIPNSPLPSGRTLIVLLYAGTSSNNMTLQSSKNLSGAGWLSPGRMGQEHVVLNSVPSGSAAFFQIVLTDNTGVRPTFIDAATVNALTFGGSYFGTSGLFTAIPAAGLSYPNICTSASSSTWVGPIQINLAAPHTPTVALGFYAVITIYGAPGVTYGIEYTTVPVNTNSWQSLTNITLAQSVGTWVDTNVNVLSPGAVQRFYRVVNQ